MVARSVFIEGKVQGVFCREWAVGKAREIGVSGWVRNHRDGRVEVYVVGDPAPVDRFIGSLHDGSPASRVDKVVVDSAAVEEALSGFTRRQTR